jgi:hypothetical protein
VTEGCTVPSRLVSLAQHGTIIRDLAADTVTREGNHCIPLLFILKLKRVRGSWSSDLDCTHPLSLSLSLTLAHSTLRSTHSRCTFSSRGIATTRMHSRVCSGKLRSSSHLKEESFVTCESNLHASERVVRRALLSFHTPLCRQQPPPTTTPATTVLPRHCETLMVHRHLIEVMQDQRR